MTVTFWLLAAAMTVAVLALIFLSQRQRQADPASRRARALAEAHASGVIDDDEYARKLEQIAASAQPGDVASAPQPRPLGLAIALAVALPLLAFALYRVIGTPAALSTPSAPLRADAAADGAAVDPHAGVEGATAPDMEKAVADLAKRLESTPDDLEGWLLLARAYKATQRYDDSYAAMQRALALSPDALEVQLEHAESEALAAPDRRFTDSGRSVLARALATDPTNQRALWLSGIDSVQREQYPEAIAHWQALETQLDPGSDIAGSVRDQITRARQVAGIDTPTPAGESPASALAAGGATDSIPVAPTGAAPAVAGANPVTVDIDISPELKSRLGEGDTLFVFARAAVGSKMPLAIQKRRASMLPLTLTLDDNMGMMPAMKMSSADTLVFGARVSSRGDATPAPGDLQVMSAPMARSSIDGPVRLVINEIVR